MHFGGGGRGCGGDGYRGNYGSRGRGNYGNRGRGGNSYNSSYGRGNDAYDNYGSTYGRGNGRNYGNKKNNGECYECGKFGHYAVKCPNKTTAKSVEMDIEKEEQVISFHSVQLNATQVNAFYPTLPKMVTKLNVGEAGKEIFECDTAASHSILTSSVYEKLRNRHPKGIPELVQESQRIQLADGTISKKVVGQSVLKYRQVILE